MSVNLPAWGHNCGRLSAALRSKYGFTAEETVFLDGCSDAASEDDTLVAAVQHDLARQVPPARIARAARLIQAYELRFWDAMAKGSGSL